MTSRRSADLGIALAAAIVVLSGCGGSTAGPSTAGGPSTAARPSSAANPPTLAPAVPTPTDAGGAANSEPACSIVSPDAVAKAAGFAIATVSGAGGTCFFQNAEPSRYLAVTLFGSQAAMALMLQIEGGGEHVANLGDDAFWYAVGGFLFVRKGDHGIQISDSDMIMSTGTAGRDALVTLARTAVPNL